MKTQHRSLNLLFRLLILLPLFSMLSACGGEEQSKTAEKDTLTEQDITIGMSLTDFKRIFASADVSQDGQWSREAVFHNLPGRWMYSFSDGRLSWFVFNSYEPEVTPENFQTCLSATRDMIAEYSRLYGLPQNHEKGIELFQDPEIRRHSGYNVIEAQWRKERGAVKVQFYFMGEEQRYQFFVTVENRA